MNDIVAGRYRLVEPIGSGGMAEVWRAVDARTGATVALKRLHPNLASDPTARARFRREIEAARLVAHPAAVRVLDAGSDDDPPWLVMEHVDGGSLAARLSAGDPIRPAEAARIGAEIAAALAALHAAGLIHRDVTPSNILLSTDGSARLADFGIARGWNGSGLEDVTVTGDLVGTLRFVAPEVLAGDPPGPAADVWALGAVLHESVTGRRPFDATSPAALLASQRTVPAMDDVDPTLSPLLGRMLDPDPKTRPDAAAVAAEMSGAAERLQATGPTDLAVEEGTVVMATAVPSRAAGVAVEPVSIGSIAILDRVASERPAAPAVRAPRSSSRSAGRRSNGGTRRGAPALLAAGLILLAVVVLGASALGRPTTRQDATAPPGVAVDATPAATGTPQPAVDDGGGGAGSGGSGSGKDKEHDKDKGDGKGKGNGHGNGNGN